ncbi:amino acid adenylation domain-containing protein [Kineosporia sp. J2-2]|uniref:Amino acid adenylation domain-containing protein n=1 Tax=Kineosporia corallincola TaxID=2835133 RepID=A0ABS5TG76_9ACTN|nr:non-ribosomal peptide synthetase [Kineosporia corallincola]MBT0770089.1 amino acid adenylation domain-containing protein [Kineosporia corallincola]
MSTDEIEKVGTGAGTAGAAVDAARQELLRRRLGGLRVERDEIVRADRERPLVLSAGQQQMWFLSRLEPESWEYVVPLAVRLAGPLDAPRLRRALSAIVGRHEVLRTRYLLDGTAPVQVVDAPAELELPVDDVSGLPAGRREETALGIARREPGRPFDLERQWPLRARLIRLTATDHVLVVVFHHIACDAWSVRQFAQELGMLYGGGTLPPLPVQYADHAAHERAFLDGPGLERQMSYWRGELDGIGTLALPTDRPRPAVRSSDGDAVRFDLGTGLSQRVADLGRRYDATPFMVLLSGFQTLLSRYTGSRDIPVGTVMSGRGRPEQQELIGYAINSLVMRARWQGDPGFGELLTRARTTVLGAFDHQAVPFARLVDELQPVRDLSRTPLFQVAFTMHESRHDAFALPGLDATPLENTSRVSRFDLTLQITQTPDGGLSGSLEYVTALFDRATVTRMTRHLVRLLEQVTADPLAPVSGLALLDDDELALAAPAPLTAPSQTSTIVGVFERQAALTPDAVAVISGDSELTYAGLNARANRIAHLLRSRGVAVETPVGLCLEHGPDLLPSLLGILKSGAAYLPLDPAHPADRLAYMIADSATALVITTSRHAGLIEPVHQGATIVLDRDQEQLAGQPETDPEPVNEPGHLIYVIYTSGSTGRPKGVALTHANLHRLLTTAQRHYDFGPGDVWALSHSYAFDFSAWELWGSLAWGGTLVVVTHEERRSPEDFLALLLRHRVTVLNQTPSAFRGLVDLAAAGDPRIDELALRVVIFGGEKLTVPDLAPWVARRGLDRTELVNMYGITETTVHTTYHRVTGSDLAPEAGNPIGHPLDDTGVYLLDAAGQLVPLGVPGEIHVSGPGVARGYLGRPDLTAQRFVPDPFGPCGARLYRSGDLARRRPDGRLEFLGRSDDQVKVRGFRIEPGEIRSVLVTHPTVRDAVVLVREDTPGELRIVAYVVPTDGTAPDPGDLRTLLARQLPSYMVPSAFVPLGRIPLTTNGKVDRAALPAPGRAALAAAQEYVAPRTALEERIAGAWLTVLGVDRVGVDDGFFELGGDSIAAVALVGALRESGVTVSVRDVFEHGSVARLAEFLGGTAGSAPGAAVERFALIGAEDRALLPDGLTDAYPLAQVQLGMVVEMLADTGRRVYHNSTCFRILDDQDFSWDAFRAAVEHVLERHEILRTSFELDRYSVPMQLVHATAQAQVGRQTLPAQDRPERESTLRAFMARERAVLFDLTKPPLVRFFAHETPGEGGWWLTLTECHAVLEGWSHHSLLMELVSVYRQVRDGEPVTEPEAAAVRYADFVAAELESLGGEDDRAYWEDVVANHERLNLPAAWAGSPDAAGVNRTWVPYRDLEPELRRIAARTGVSLKTVMLSAHLAVMSRITDEDAFCSGLVTNARPEARGAERVAGVYLNPLPFPFRRDAARTWDDLLRQVFATELGLWPHRRFPMGVMQREFNGGRRMLDVRFSYQDFRQVDTEVIDYAATIDDSPTEFPLGVSTRAGFLVLTAQARYVEAARLAALGDLYRGVLEALVTEGPDGLVGVPVRATDWGTGVPPLAGAAVCVPAAFAATAARRPRAVAVRCGDQALDFAGLDARASRIANLLAAQGVVRGDVVGVLLERGPDLIAALLGVWRAGAAFVPLDQAFPDDRTALMLSAAGARTVLTRTSLAGRFHEVPVALVDGDEMSSCATDHVAVDLDPDELAYVIFTSGSTGTPKGVAVSHRGLANHVAWAAAELAMRGTGGSALFSSVAFDLVVPNVWAPLTTGQPVHVVPESVDLSELGAALVNSLRTARSSGFSFLKLTPGHLEVLGRQLEDGVLAGLAGVVVVAGEALPGALAERWRGLLGDGRLVNEYGPTETSVGACVLPVSGPQGEGVVPIGRPLPGTRMYVLDAGLAPVTTGVPGELYVGGVGVARGYVGRAALTAERFLPDPFAGGGARMYRTGDRVRWVERPPVGGDPSRLATAGVADFLGRVDDQVKVRGYRIEPGEVAAVVRDCPGVDEAVVVVDGEGSDARLVCYVTGDATDAGAYCRERLPEYLVPAVFVRLETLPLNRNGKVDRTALPPVGGAGESARAFVAPEGPQEELIARIWCQVLELDRVSVDDSFFAVGGHSIRAIALVGALRAAGLPAQVKDVFEQRTVRALAATLAPGAPVTENPGVEPFSLIGDDDRALLPGGLTDAYPLAQVQLGMLVEMLADETRNRYHNTASFRVRDGRPFRVEALRRAADAVLERHEMLRTSFDLDRYSVPMQLVHAGAAMPVQVRDLRDLDPAGVGDDLARFTARERATLFDLGQAPLMRITAHVESDECWWMSVSVCHPITEGWSHRALLMELVEGYLHERAGERPPPRELPAVRYADFVAAERDSLNDDGDREFWAGVVSGHERFVLPPGWGGPAGTHLVRVPLDDLRPRLEALAGEADASLKSVLLAAHLAVLGRLTDRAAFHTGLVCSGRPEVLGSEKVYGMYLNTLPFPHVREPGTWGGLIRRTFGTEAEIWPHRRFPMPEIQRMAGEGRLLDARFSYLDLDRSAPDGTDVVDAGSGLGEGATEFALAVAARGSEILLTVDTAVLSPDAAARLGGAYRSALESLVREGLSGRVAVPGLAVDVRHGEGVPPLPAAAVNVPTAVGVVAARMPGLPAVWCGGSALGFGDLEVRAARIAGFLAANGVGRGSVVGVLLERGPDLIASLLAVWRAGAAFVPLDQAFPADRVSYMLTAAGAGTVLTQASLADRFVGPDGSGGTGCRVVVLDGADAAGIAGCPPVRAAVDVDPDELAYVIFTSGSTGRPKGVAVSHRGLANHVSWAVARLALRGTGGSALFSSVAFDLVVPNVWASLVAGQPVHVVPESVDLSGLGDALVSSLNRSGSESFSFLKLTPGHLEVLGRQLEDDVLAGLSGVIVVAGEALPGALAERWRGLLGDGRLVNEYGPTETSVGACVLPVSGSPGEGVVPIGRSLPGVRMYLLDADLEPVAAGVPGELFVGGEGVARGYVGRPGASAERFLPDPFAGGGARMYRTGDRARWVRRDPVPGDPSGSESPVVVDFLGRMDDQVKIRGYRIELGEVAAVARDCPGVGEAVAVVDGEGADARLVCYVTGDAPDVEEFCRERLPEYLVPSVFVRLEAMPLNRNGKIDRTALPPVGDVAETAVLVAPVGAREELIARIWCEVLELDRVSVEDSFFAVGGHSIRAIALVGALRAAGLPVQVKDVFQHRTVRALARVVPSSTTAETTGVEAFSMIGAGDRDRLPAGVTDAFPLAQVQLGMIVEMLGDDAQNRYVNASTFRIRDDAGFQAGALRRAAATVVARHEMLRTSIHLDEFSEPLQLVHESAELPVRVADLRGRDEEEAVREWLAAERAAPFDLAAPPLLRIGALVLDDGSWRLAFTHCHAVTEGWSQHNLLMEVLDLYRAYVAGDPEPDWEKPVSRYAEFVAAERAALADDGDRAFWQDVVTRHRGFVLPEGWGERRGGVPERFRVRVGFRDLEPALRDLGRSADASFKSVLLAAHLKVLSQLTGEPAFHTGLVSSGRPETEGSERVYGMFLNTLPFPHDRSAATWRDLVRQTFDTEAAIWGHRHFPMPEIQRMAGGRKLLHVMFNYTDFHQVDGGRVDVRGGSSDSANEFLMSVNNQPGQLTLRMMDHAVGRAGAEQIAAMYRTVLEAMAADPDGPAQPALLSEAERNRLLHEWNDTDVEW